MSFIKTLFFISFSALLFTNCFKRTHEIKPPQEKVIRLILSGKVSSLDPHITDDVYSAEVQSLVYENLYYYHYLKRPYELLPLLAEGLPKVSADHKTFTFKIKKGIFFQDSPCFPDGKGREFTAQDVIYNIHRFSAPQFISPAFSSYEHRVAGIDEYHAGKSKTISGIKLLDPYTFEVHLTQVLPRFVYNFSDSHAAMVAKECIEKYGSEFGRHAVGTGPFIITHYEPGKIVAIKNPNYHSTTYPIEGMPGDKEKGLLEDAGKQLPLVDKVIFEALSEDQPAWLKFVAGETEMSSIPKDNFASALPSGKLSHDLEKRGVQLFQGVRSDVTIQAFNMSDPVWGKHKELRQAFALALDNPQIIEIQYSGQAVRADTIINPNQYGFDSKFKSQWHDRNIQKAKALLAKAGFPDGKGLSPLTILTTEGSTARQLDELMAKQLAQAGIVLKTDVLTWPQLMLRIHQRDYTSTGFAWASDFPDADDALPAYHSRGITSGINPAGYHNFEVDRLIDEIGAMENGPERLSKIKRVKEIVDEDLPYVPMVHRIGVQLVQPWLKNHVYCDAMYVGPFLKYHRVDILKK